MVVGVIDVGSNAIRMAVGKISGRKYKLIRCFREPLRLGGDTFSRGFVSERKIRSMVQVFKRFQQVFDKHQVERYSAVATSAVREAKNRKELLRRVYVASQIRLKTINGLEEARLIHLAVSKVLRISKRTTLMIDIGGGSVELVLARGPKILSTHSIKIGTVRMLETAKHKKPQFTHFKNIIYHELVKLKKLRTQVKNCKSVVLVGTGGNVRALHNLAKRLNLQARPGRLSFDEFEDLALLLFSLNREQRMTKLGLRPDRADVILPAACILLEVMRLYQIRTLMAPKVGLKNGLFWNM